MILVIDNYDSFTYNLVQYFGQLGAEVQVFRNDQITVAEAEKLLPTHLVISPGPCTPKEAGVSCEMISFFGGKIPVLGVCLGHQCIGEVYGGKVVRAKRLMHGKTSQIFHNGQGIFANVPCPFDAVRYHSLIVERESLPSCLRITAETSEGEIMALQHVSYPVFGVQFHPESVLTEHGITILKNFLSVRV